MPAIVAILPQAASDQARPCETTMKARGASKARGRKGRRSVARRRQSALVRPHSIGSQSQGFPAAVNRRCCHRTSSFDGCGRGRLSHRTCRQGASADSPAGSASEVRRVRGCLLRNHEWGGCPPRTGLPFGTRARRFFGPPLRAMPACPGKTSLKVWSG